MLPASSASLAMLFLQPLLAAAPVSEACPVPTAVRPALEGADAVITVELLAEPPLEDAIAYAALVRQVHRGCLTVGQLVQLVPAGCVPAPGAAGPYYLVGGVVTGSPGPNGAGSRLEADALLVPWTNTLGEAAAAIAAAAPPAVCPPPVACADAQCDGACCEPGEVCSEECGCCSPLCDGKECGPDYRCGGSCGQCPGELDCFAGTCGCIWGEPCGDTCCGPGEICHDGACCDPSCTVVSCGDDGCGGVCGVCPPGAPCGPSGVCEPEPGFASDSSCYSQLDGVCVGDWHCFDGGSKMFNCALDGGYCGSWAASAWEIEPAHCEDACSCEDNGAECGELELSFFIGASGDTWTECKADCGPCPDGQQCKGNQCVSFGCVPDCSCMMCGDDGCGGSCGECEDQHVCSDGTCVPLGPSCSVTPPAPTDPCKGYPDVCCLTATTLATCGPGGLEFEDCGACSDHLPWDSFTYPEPKCWDTTWYLWKPSSDVSCTAGIACEPWCGCRECGSDGCGGSCGGCPEGSTCHEGACAPCGIHCATGGLPCGDDGCGGSCGDCPEGVACGPDGRCVACTEDCVGHPCGAFACDDGDPCTLDSCVGGGACAHAPVDSPACGVTCDATLAVHTHVAPPGSGGWESLALAGAHLLAVGVTGRLDTLRLAPPAPPQLVHSLYLGPGVDHVVLEGHTAFVVGDEGLYIVAVQAPESPHVVATVPLASPRSVAVRDGLAYVAVPSGPTPDSKWSMQLVDVADPSAPVLRGAAHLPTWYGSGYWPSAVTAGPHGVHAVSDVLGADDLLRVIATNTTAPQVVASSAGGGLDSSYAPSGVDARGERLYVSVGHYLLVYLHTTPTAAPALMGAATWSYPLGTFGGEKVAALDGGLALVGGQLVGGSPEEQPLVLTVFDASDPAAPVIAAQLFEEPFGPTPPVGHGPWVYRADGAGGLTVLELSCAP